MTEVAYIECMAAQEAAYWEARRQRMQLNDKQIGDLLRAAAPHLRAKDAAEVARLTQIIRDHWSPSQAEEILAGRKNP